MLTLYFYNTLKLLVIMPLFIFFILFLCSDLFSLLGVPSTSHFIASPLHPSTVTPTATPLHRLSINPLRSLASGGSSGSVGDSYSGASDAARHFEVGMNEATYSLSWLPNQPQCLLAGMGAKFLRLYDIRGVCVCVCDTWDIFPLLLLVHHLVKGVQHCTGVYGFVRSPVT